jgi:hypothetical protein
MITVPLRGKVAAGRVALVDDDDHELVSQHTWIALRTRRPGVFYAYSNTQVLMHRLILGCPEFDADHIDGNGLNNQRHNLRLATRSQNLANMRPRAGGSSRFKGVHWDRVNGRWRAMIQVNGHMRAIGRYSTEEAAARAYDAAALAAWGEFACPNFPGRPLHDRRPGLRRDLRWPDHLAGRGRIPAHDAEALMNWKKLAGYRKSIVAAIGVAAVVGVALAPTSKWVAVAVAAATALGVYSTPNRKPPA